MAWIFDISITHLWFKEMTPGNMMVWILAWMSGSSNYHKVGGFKPQNQQCNEICFNAPAVPHWFFVSHICQRNICDVLTSVKLPKGPRPGDFERWIQACRMVRSPLVRDILCTLSAEREKQIWVFETFLSILAVLYAHSSHAGAGVVCYVSLIRSVQCICLGGE